MGENVLQECMSSKWPIFQEYVSYRNACFTGGQVLLEGMSYRRSHLTGIYILQEYMFYKMAYHTR